MKYVLMFVLLFLPACSPYKQSFNCPVPKGYPCTSMTRIHELIDEGAFMDTNKSQECKRCQQNTKGCTSEKNWVEAVIVGDEVRKYVLSTNSQKRT